MSVTLQQVRETLSGGNEITGKVETRRYDKSTYVTNFEGEVDGEFWYDLESSNWFEVDGLGTLEFQDGYSGGEGGGSDVYSVFKIGDQYFKKTGYYASHYGTDWDGDIYEVTPEEKTITVYRPVK